MQNIKPEDMTKLEEYRMWLLATGNLDDKSKPVESSTATSSASPAEVKGDADGAPTP